MPILLIPEKPFAKFAIMQSQQNIVSLKGITDSKSTQIRLKNYNTTFELQRPDIESCRAEAMLRLFIAERCFFTVDHRFPTFFETGTPFIKIKQHSHPLLSEKRRNHRKSPIFQYLHFLIIITRPATGRRPGNPSPEVFKNMFSCYRIVSRRKNQLIAALLVTQAY